MVVRHLPALLACGRRHSLGRLPDGTVAAAGDGTAGECAVQGWREVVAVAAGNVHPARNTGRSHSLALRSDGTVLATGWDADGQCQVGRWRDIVALAAGWCRSVGLLADGRVLAAGRTAESACDVSPWREVVAVAAGDWHTVGVRADGTAVATGVGRFGQCAVQSWHDLVDVAAGYLHTVGLRGDGTVVSAGRGDAGACDVGGWSDVVAIAAGSHHTIALTADGSVRATGANGAGQCDVSGWRDVVHVAAGAAHTLALRADGTVLTAGDNADGQCAVAGWRCRRQGPGAAPVTRANGVPHDDPLPDAERDGLHRSGLLTCAGASRSVSSGSGSLPSMTSDLRVCFLGDSFVAGTGDPDHLGWAGRLAARTHRAGRPLTVYNLGVRRQTSSDIRQRWLAECSLRLPAGCDGRLVLSFGVNDTTVEDGRQRVDAATSVANLTELLNGARRAGWAVLVVGPPPVADSAQNDRTARLDLRIAATCGPLQVRCVNPFSALSRSSVWMRQVAAGDGAHPAGEGYAVLADLLWPAWSDWLTSPTRP